MARTTPPSLQAYIGEIPYTAVTVNRALPSATWLTGDVIVIVAGEEGSAANNGPTCAASQFGLTLAGSTVNSGSPASRCGAGVWTAVAPSDNTGAIVLSDSSAGASRWGANGFQFRNSDGLGQRFITAAPSSTRTISVTPTDAHSGYVWALYDWNTNSYTGAAFTPSPTDSRELGLAGGGGGYTISVADLVDMASSSPTNFGLTATAPSAGVFTIVGAEILGTGAATAVPPELVMAAPAHNW